MFTILREINISIKPSKLFLTYFIVLLLNQRIDAFDLFIIIDKLKVISKLDFPTTLKIFEIYIDITGFFRNYILYYAQIVEAL